MYSKVEFFLIIFFSASSITFLDIIDIFFFLTERVALKNIMITLCCGATALVHAKTPETLSIIAFSLFVQKALVNTEQ